MSPPRAAWAPGRLGAGRWPVSTRAAGQLGPLPNTAVLARPGLGRSFWKVSRKSALKCHLPGVRPDHAPKPARRGETGTPSGAEGDQRPRPRRPAGRSHFRRKSAWLRSSRDDVTGPPEVWEPALQAQAQCSWRLAGPGGGVGFVGLSDSPAGAGASVSRSDLLLPFVCGVAAPPPPRPWPGPPQCPP